MYIQKPPRGARVNLAHPLARGLVGAWLFNEMAGSAVSLINPADVLKITDGTGTWGSGVNGSAMKTGSAAVHQGANLNAPSADLKPTNEVTLWWRGVWAGTGTWSGNPALVAMANSNADVSPYISYGLLRFANGTDIAVIYAVGAGYTLDSYTGVIASGVPLTLALALSTRGYKLYKNGIQIQSSTGFTAPLVYGATAKLMIGEHVANSGHVDTTNFETYIWNRELSFAEIQWLQRKPYEFVLDPFIPHAAALGGINGTGNVTLDNITSAGAGTLPIAGTGSVTLANVTSTDTGKLAIAGAGATTLANVTSAGAGTLAIAGTGNVTLGAVTSAGAGVLPIAGTGNVTLGNITSTDSGALAIAGTGSSTLANITSSGAGALAIAGTGSITLAAITSTGSGALTTGPTGTGNVTLDNVTSAGAGVLPIAATGNVTLASITTSGNGALAISGTGSVTLGAVASAGTGALPIAGTGNVTLANVTSSGAGTLVSGPAGTGSVTLDNITTSGSGALAIMGTGSVTLGNITSISSPPVTPDYRILAVYDARGIMAYPEAHTLAVPVDNRSF